MNNSIFFPVAETPIRADVPAKDNHQCPHCEKRYSMKSSLTNHIRYTHSPASQSMLCTICQKSFKHKMSFQGHWWRYHKNEDQKLKETCLLAMSPTQMKLKNKNILKVRTYVKNKSSKIVETANNIKDCAKFVCDVCQKQFISNENLTRHVLKIHTSAV